MLNYGNCKATTTVTATKTSLKNITSFYLHYFAVISAHPAFTKTAIFPGTKLLGVAFELRKRMKNSPSCAHVLHKTLNLVFSCLVLQRTAKNCAKI